MGGQVQGTLGCRYVRTCLRPRTRSAGAVRGCGRAQRTAGGGACCTHPAACKCACACALGCEWLPGLQPDVPGTHTSAQHHDATATAATPLLSEQYMETSCGQHIEASGQQLLLVMLLASGPVRVLQGCGAAGAQPPAQSPARARAAPVTPGSPFRASQTCRCPAGSGARSCARWWRTRAGRCQAS